MKRTVKALPTSRIVVLRTITIVMTLVMVGRFFQVSVLDHAQAVKDAANQYGTTQTLKAQRGKIAMQDLNDHTTYTVAYNKDTFTVIADPFIIKDAAATANALSPIISVDAKELTDKLSDKHKRFSVLKKKLTKDVAQKVIDLKLKGITTQTVAARYYPESTLGAHIIGFVNEEGDGKNGIESYFDEDLRGYDGSVTGQKDAKRRIIVEDKTAKPRDGSEIVLTIDHNLQFMVEQHLQEALKKYEADSGSIIVMDTKTGGILAMANAPSYDLNNYGSVPTDQQNVFINKAVSNSWEPGSIFKSFTLAAGIDMGLYDTDTKVELPCSVKVNGFEIHNAEDKCYTNPSIVEVLAESINIGTMWAADQVGNESFSKYISNFGFGSKTGIELQPEATGKILELKKWKDVNRATFSFGQGLTVSPLQIVSAYAAIANKGKLMRPYIVDKRIQSDGKEIETKPQEIRQVIKPETATKMTTLLDDVVVEGHGKKAAVPGYKIAGKTGTAQVVGDDGKYAEDQHIGSFAGYFPSDNPRFAMVVKLDKPKAVEFAESSAAPTFGEIAKWLLHYAKVAPTEPLQ